MKEKGFLTSQPIVIVTKSSDEIIIKMKRRKMT